MSSPVRRWREGRSTPSMSGHGKWALKLLLTASKRRFQRAPGNWCRSNSPTLMSYQACSCRKERNNHVQADRSSSTGSNHWGLLLRTGRESRGSRRTRLRRYRRGEGRPPANAGECRRRRAKNNAALCGGRLLLLGPGASTFVDGRKTNLLGTAVRTAVPTAWYGKRIEWERRDRQLVPWTDAS